MANEKYTLDLVNTEGINQKGMELLQKLNSARQYRVSTTKQSIMDHGDYCNCDDGWLCEHRLQVIADWIKENQNG